MSVGGTATRRSRGLLVVGEMVVKVSVGVIDMLAASMLDPLELELERLEKGSMQVGFEVQE